MAVAVELASAARVIIPASWAFGAAMIGTLDQEPLPEEAPYIAGAVEKRRLAFVTSRHLARKALAELRRGPYPGRTSQSTRLAGRRRRNHHIRRGYCLVAAERRARLAGLGIDLTEHRELDANLIDLMCTPS